MFQALASVKLLFSFSYCHCLSTFGSMTFQNEDILMEQFKTDIYCYLTADMLTKLCQSLCLAESLDGLRQNNYHVLQKLHNLII